MKNFFKKIKNKIYQKNLKAFTLIESLASILLIMIAVLGPLTITLNGLKSVSQNRDRVIATYLAESYIEEIKNLRDSIFLKCTKNGSISYDNNNNNLVINCNSASASENLYSHTFNNSSDNNQSFQKAAWEIFRNIATSSKTDIDLNVIFSNLGYSTTSGIGNTNFKREITITPILVSSNNTNYFLKIEVKVFYTNGIIFGIGDRYVYLVDYIYER